MPTRQTGGRSVVDAVSSTVFARTFGQRAGQLAWFLGAGASAAANVPTGMDMILDFKTRLFCADTRIPRREIDISDPIWEERITSYFDGSRGLPPAGDPDEYAAAFEAAYPEARDRRSYVDQAAKRGTPSYAHRVLAALITTGYARCLFTTNFDQLVERSTVITDELLPAERRAHITVGALDSVERAERCLRDDSWPLLVKLHGDYQSERLKNTSQELQTQDEGLRQVLVGALARFGLVVVGYSGRDDSIMDALDEAVSTEGAFPSGLWWVTRSGATLLPRIETLLERAVESGVDVRIVQSESFDELAGDIEREVSLDGPLLQHVRGVQPGPLVEPAALPTKAAAQFPVLRCSALQVLELPSKARRVTVDRPITTREARRLIREAEIWATVASRGRELLVFGADEDLERAFSTVGGELEGTVRLNPAEDSIDTGLVYDAFTRAITRRRPLRRLPSWRGHHAVVRPPDDDRSDVVARKGRERLNVLSDAYDSGLTGTVPKARIRFAEAIRVRLEHWGGQWWCVYEPYTWVDLPRPATASSRSREPTRGGVSESEYLRLKTIAADWRRERWARRYNPKWNEIISAWAKVIAPEPETEVSAHYFKGAGTNAVFRISQTTAWSSPGNTLAREAK